MPSSIDRVLDVLDVGIQSSTDHGYGTDRSTGLCARCQRNEPVDEDSDFCAGCRAFLLEDTDEDPTMTRTTASGITYGINQIRVYLEGQEVNEVTHHRPRFSNHAAPTHYAPWRVPDDPAELPIEETMQNYYSYAPGLCIGGPLDGQVHPQRSGLDYGLQGVWPVVPTRWVHDEVTVPESAIRVRTVSYTVKWYRRSGYNTVPAWVWVADGIPERMVASRLH